MIHSLRGLDVFLEQKEVNNVMYFHMNKYMSHGMLWVQIQRKVAGGICTQILSELHLV